MKEPRTYAGAALDEQAREIQRQMQSQAAPRCPYCDRVMSNREAIEQGACNDCNGGAYWPNH